jgi:hypothetical protein
VRVVVGLKVVFVTVRLAMRSGRVMVARLCRLHVLSKSLVWSFWVALPSVLATVPPVLHCIVATALEPTCNFGPPLAHLGHHLLDQLSLVGRDGVVIQCRLQVLVEALSALLRRPRTNLLWNADPVVWAVAGDEVYQPLVFVLRPRATAMSDHDEGPGSVWMRKQMSHSRNRVWGSAGWSSSAGFNTGFFVWWFTASLVSLDGAKWRDHDETASED